MPGPFPGSSPGCWPEAPVSAVASSTASTALPSATPGARLNDVVAAGNCPWRLMTSGPVVSDGPGDRAERHLAAGCAAEINRLQPVGSLLEVGLDIENYPVLVQAP